MANTASSLKGLMLHLVIGPSRESIRVYHSLLDRNTSYFAPVIRQVCPGQVNYVGTFESDDVLRVELPDEDYGQVLAYVHWLHTGKLSSIKSSTRSYGLLPNLQESQEYALLSQMFAFGHRIGDKKYQDAAITAILQAFAESSSSSAQPSMPSMEYGKWAHRTCGPDDNLTRLFLDIHAYCIQHELRSEDTCGFVLEAMKAILPLAMKQAWSQDIDRMDPDTIVPSLKACDYHCGHEKPRNRLSKWQCPYEWVWPLVEQQEEGATATNGRLDNLAADKISVSRSVAGNTVAMEANATIDQSSTAATAAPIIAETTATENKANVPPQAISAAMDTFAQDPNIAAPQEDAWAWIGPDGKPKPTDRPSIQRPADDKITEYLYKSKPEMYRSVSPKDGGFAEEGEESIAPQAVAAAGAATRDVGEGQDDQTAESATSTEKGQSPRRIAPWLEKTPLINDAEAHHYHPLGKTSDQIYWENVRAGTKAAIGYSPPIDPPLTGAAGAAYRASLGGRGTGEHAAIWDDRDSPAGPSPVHTPAIATASAPQGGPLPAPQPIHPGHWVYRVASPNLQVNSSELDPNLTTSINDNHLPICLYPNNQSAEAKANVRRITRSYWGEPWCIDPEMRKKAYADRVQQTQKAPDN